MIRNILFFMFVLALLWVIANKPKKNESYDNQNSSTVWTFSEDLNDAVKAEIVYSRLAGLEQTYLVTYGELPPPPIKQISKESSIAYLSHSYRLLVANYEKYNDNSVLSHNGIGSKMSFKTFVEDSIKIEQSKCVYPANPCHLDDEALKNFAQQTILNSTLFASPASFEFDKTKDVGQLDQLRDYLIKNPQEVPQGFYFYGGRTPRSIQEAEKYAFEGFKKQCEARKQWCMSRLGMQKK